MITEYHALERASRLTERWRVRTRSHLVAQPLRSPPGEPARTPRARDTVRQIPRLSEIGCKMAGRSADRLSKHLYGLDFLR